MRAKLPQTIGEEHTNFCNIKQRYVVQNIAFGTDCGTTAQAAATEILAAASLGAVGGTTATCNFSVEVLINYGETQSTGILVCEGGSGQCSALM